MTARESLLLQLHLQDHESGIETTSKKLAEVQHPVLASILNTHRGIMLRHVTIMLDFLAGKSIPPRTGLEIQITPPGSTKNARPSGTSAPSHDQVACLDSLALARRLSGMNLESALEFNDLNLRKVHLSMARDQAHAASQLYYLASDEQWTMTPLAANSGFTQALVDRYNYLVDQQVAMAGLGRP